MNKAVAQLHALVGKLVSGQEPAPTKAIVILLSQDGERSMLGVHSAGSVNSPLEAIGLLEVAKGELHAGMHEPAEDGPMSHAEVLEFFAQLGERSATQMQADNGSRLYAKQQEEGGF